MKRAAKTVAIVLVCTILVGFISIGVAIWVFDVGTVTDGWNDYNSTLMINKKISALNDDTKAIEAYIGRCVKDDKFPAIFRGYLLVQGTRYGVSPAWIDDVLMESLSYGKIWDDTRSIRQFYRGQIFEFYVQESSRYTFWAYPARSLLFGLKSFESLKKIKVNIQAHTI